MPPEEQLRRMSSTKKIKCYSKYCILVLIFCVSIVIIPAVYMIYAVDIESNVKEHEEDFLLEYRGKMRHPPLPWYTSEGVRYPNVSEISGVNKVWPEEDNSDRIESQLMFKPKVSSRLVKTILMYHKIPQLSLADGQDSFFGCPIESCSISNDLKDIESADAVVFNDEEHLHPTLRKGIPYQQVWILFLPKNPIFTKNLDNFSGLINWTASYRSDSDIVVPFVKWVYYNSSMKENPEVATNVAAGRTRKVVWFVKNPSDDHNRRREYVEELMKYIDVDVFGKAKDYECPCLSIRHCFRVLNKYKFFIAFENSNCRDYITKRFFISLQRGILPVVMGAPIESYINFAPQHSFIHVDQFSSPRKLAEYLHELDQNDDMYNAYFRWRGMGEMVDTRVECRLCTLLHSSHDKTYADMDLWWRKNACMDQ